MTKTRSIFKSDSLETQLQRQLFLVLSLVLMTVLVVIHLSVQQLSVRFVASGLQHDAESLLAGITKTPSSEWTIEESRINSVYQRPYSGHYFIVSIGTQEIRSRSLWDIDLDRLTLQDEVSSKPVIGHFDGPHGQEWVTVTVDFTSEDQTLRFWLAEDIKPLLTLQLQFEIGVILLFVLSVLFLLFLQRKIIRQNFLTFDQMHQAIESFHQGEELIFPKNVPDEVKELVGVIERTLIRSTKQVQRSRTAVGNLAHELKRPLQNLRWLAENSHDSKSDDLTLIYEQLQNLVVRELRRAAISGNPSPGKRFKPKIDLPMFETLLERQYGHSKKLILDLPEGSLPFDRDDMLELIGNLLDNAWRFSKTSIHLTVHPGVSNNWQITIEDDGLGLSELDCDMLTERGVTKDEATGHHQGLGLHICQAVVESYDGEMTLMKSEWGGLKVLIHLPNTANA